MRCLHYRRLVTALAAMAVANIGLIFVESVLSGHSSASVKGVEPVAFLPEDSQSADDSQTVYSDNPADPWNRIFGTLFSRMVRTRLSPDFPEGAPFTTVAGVTIG